MELEKKLKSIFKEVLEIDESKIGDDTTSKNLEKWDSMNHMNLIVSIEEEFDLEIDEDDILDLMSYKLLLKYLQSNVK